MTGTVGLFHKFASTGLVLLTNMAREAETTMNPGQAISVRLYNDTCRVEGFTVTWQHSQKWECHYYSFYN